MIDYYNQPKYYQPKQETTTMEKIGDIASLLIITTAIALWWFIVKA